MHDITDKDGMDVNEGLLTKKARKKIRAEAFLVTLQEFLNLSTLFDVATCLPLYLILHPTTTTFNVENLFDLGADNFNLAGKPINPNPLLFPRYLR